MAKVPVADTSADVTDTSVQSSARETSGSANHPAVSPSLSLTRTPEQWAELLYPVTPTGRLHDDAWKHAAADQLHGWTHFANTTGKPVELTREVYDACIAAASGNSFAPHPAGDCRRKD